MHNGYIIDKLRGNTLTDEEIKGYVDRLQVLLQSKITQVISGNDFLSCKTYDDLEELWSAHFYEFKLSDQTLTKYEDYVTYSDNIGRKIIKKQNNRERDYFNEFNVPINYDKRTSKIMRISNIIVIYNKRTFKNRDTLQILSMFDFGLNEITVQFPEQSNTDAMFWRWASRANKAYLIGRRHSVLYDAYNRKIISDFFKNDISYTVPKRLEDFEYYVANV